MRRTALLWFFLPLALAPQPGCERERVTAARVVVSRAPGVEADQLRAQVLVAGTPLIVADVPKRPSGALGTPTDFVVRFPDSSAGRQATFLVASLRGGAQTGRGDGSVVLALGKTVTVQVTLQAAACPAGQHSCAGTCFPDGDLAHCGLACLECVPPAAHGKVACEAGMCVTSCDAGYTDCGGQCVNLKNDPDNCGHCGGICGSSLVCKDGQCIPNPCPAGKHLCGTECVSDTDVAHCGRACEPCPDPENGSPTCDGVSCGVLCDGGYHACGSQCLSNTSPASCGDRCEPCPLPSGGNGVAICMDGQCGIMCDLDYHLCGDVCVTNDDPAHCGSKCEPCPEPENAVATCSAGMCGFECRDGFKPCRGQCIPASQSCEVTWVQRFPPTSPPGRTRPAMAYDAARREVVLFGGWNGYSALDDTWTWDGTSWTKRSPSSSPSARSAAAMAYDAERQRVVLFGGEGISAFPPSKEQLGDTWVWDGSTWTGVVTTQGPQARSFASASWDGGSKRVFLFGGWNGSSALNDLWAWNGSSWTRVTTPGAAPSPRAGFGMIADPARWYSILVFGGSQDSAAGGLFDDTWAFGSGAWTELQPSMSPGARAGHGLVYHAGLGVGLLFGGLADFGSYLDDTWVWNGDWAEVATTQSPSGRWRFGMVYDSGRNTVVLFGGAAPPSTYFNETWELAF